MRVLILSIRIKKGEEIHGLLHGLPKFLTSFLNRDVEYFAEIEDDPPPHREHEEGLARDGGASGV